METLNRDAFAFVQKLAEELSGGQVQLPSYPEVALRVQRALANENSSLNTVVRAVVVEPALSMQVMRMANSVALNSSGQQVHDLNAAVQRIGYSMVRAAALSFVMQQLRSAEGLRPLRQRLNDLWRRGVVVGTVCRSVGAPDPHGDTGCSAARRAAAWRRQALHPHAAPESSTPARTRGGAEKIIAEWHGNVARALLENWEMPEEFGNAVAEFEDSGARVPGRGQPHGRARGRRCAGGSRSRRCRGTDRRVAACGFVHPVRAACSIGWDSTRPVVSKFSPSPRLRPAR